MRVLLVGGTGPVGQASVPFLRAAGHEVAVAHTGAHEPAALADVEHLHGPRDALLAPGGPVERHRPDALVDTFPGGATAAKARALTDLARRAGTDRVVAVSSIDVHRHCADAGVDGHPPALLARDPLPLREDAPKRAARAPGAEHDNVAMEAALGDVPSLTVLRPGAIYGLHLHPHVLREWDLVGRVARGERRLPLPAGGTQLFHRVALERVGRAVAAAADLALPGRTAVSVADPHDLTYGALAGLVADVLDWAWDPEEVPYDVDAHPWAVRHPVLVDTTRLRELLGVQLPDPLAATRAQVAWLWEHRDAVAAVPTG